MLFFMLRSEVIFYEDATDEAAQAAGKLPA